MSLVAVVGSDLIVSTRILDAATAEGHEARRVDAPHDLPPPESVAIAFVDWSERDETWAPTLVAWRGAAESAEPRIVLFGPHTDLEAHAAARASGLGPMLARSSLFNQLPDLVKPGAGPA